jgi:hypothetical protein
MSITYGIGYLQNNTYGSFLPVANDRILPVVQVHYSTGAILNELQFTDAIELNTVLPYYMNPSNDAQLHLCCWRLVAATPSCRQFRFLEMSVTINFCSGFSIEKPSNVRKQRFAV